MRTTHRYLGPVQSLGNHPNRPTEVPVIDLTESPPPSPDWWESYHVEQRDNLMDLDNPSPARSPSPLSDDFLDGKSAEDDILGGDLESNPVDVAAMYVALGVIKTEANSFRFNKIRDSSACEQFSRKNIEATCIMFKHPISKISNKDKVTLAGLKQPLQIIQAFAIYIIMEMCYGYPTGCLLADEMGFGKVSYSTARFC